MSYRSKYTLIYFYKIRKRDICCPLYTSFVHGQAVILSPSKRIWHYLTNSQTSEYSNDPVSWVGSVTFFNRKIHSFFYL